LPSAGIARPVECSATHGDETHGWFASPGFQRPSDSGRPSAPTDQAWIETLWGHLKWEHPHLLTITDPAILAAELERLRHHYNTVRLHEAIGYVTPNDEHEGRGDTIPRRQDRRPRDRRRTTTRLAPRPPEPAMTATRQQPTDAA